MIDLLLNLGLPYGDTIVVAGMAYAVFNGEQEIASGYYGYADKENNIEVDKDTVFEWGSASKLMVWVSVMQLVEQGKISLEADIQEYLPSMFSKILIMMLI